MPSRNNEGKIGYSTDTEIEAADILTMLKDVPDACCIFKVLTDPFGTVKDMLFLYANDRYARLAGATNADDLIGNTYHSCVKNQDEDWIRFAYQAAILRQSSTNRTYNSSLEKWFEFWVGPVYHKGFCAFIIHDVTSARQNAVSMEFRNNSNSLVIECAKALATPAYGKGLKKALGIIGKKLDAHRVYIVRNEGSKIKERVEWVSKSCSVELPSKKMFEVFDIISMWEKQLDGKDVVLVNDTAIEAEEHPMLYREYLAGKCYRFAISVLKDKGTPMGYLVVGNYSLETDVNIEEVLVSAGAFISFYLKNNDLRQELMYLGSHDPLTDLGNRYALRQLKTTLENMDGTIGICYTDINGLKYINEEYGHEEGDRVVSQIASIFSAIFKKKNCFRIGGDEFIAVIQDIDEVKFGDMVEKFKQKTKGEPIAVGSVWLGNARHIDDAIKIADEAMYKSKEQYYREHGRRSTDNIEEIGKLG